MPNRAINFPKIGNLLISAPFIQDDDFTRAVVLICEIQTVGVVGLTLNKPTFFKLGDLIKDLEFLEKEVFFGGPVEQNSLHYIYMAELPIEGSISIGKNLWWGGDFEILLKEIKLGSLPLRSIRFFFWGTVVGLQDN